MAIYAVVNGATGDAADVNQFKNLMTGVMTDQAVKVANKIGAAGMTNAANPVLLVGSNSSGAPTAGTWAVGDVAGDLTGKLWMCTVAGTPGTWTQLGLSAMNLIATATASASTSISISSIPSTYNVLLLEWINLSGSTNLSGLIRFNGDTGFNYNTLIGWSQNGTAASGQSSITPSQYMVYASGSVFASGSLWMPGYAIATAPRAVLLRSNTGNTTPGAISNSHEVGHWNNSAAAINQITITASPAGNFTGSFLLYGIK